MNDTKTRNIIIEVSDGMIQAVHCPDATYVVDVLDHDAWRGADDCADRYFSELEKEIENMENCY